LDSFTGSLYGNDRLYTGREYDSEIGLYYYRARYYDAETGRFISRDPIGYADDVNLYGYVGNSPVNYVDPLGLAMRGIWAFGYFMKWVIYETPKNIITWGYQMIRHPIKNIYEPTIDWWRVMGSKWYKLFSSDTVEWVKICTKDYIETTSPWKLYQDFGEIISGWALFGYLKWKASKTKGGILNKIWWFQKNALIKSGNIIDRNWFTKVGRSLQKHSSRGWDILEKFKPLNKKPIDYNKAWENILKNILNDSNKLVNKKVDRFWNKIIDIYSNNWKWPWARFDSEGIFKNFLNP